MKCYPQSIKLKISYNKKIEYPRLKLNFLPLFKVSYCSMFDDIELSVNSKAKTNKSYLNKILESYKHVSIYQDIK